MKFYRELFTIARESRKMTQERLSKAIGVTQQAVQQWEDGKSRPRPANVYAAAKALGVSVCDISDLAPKDEPQAPDITLNDPLLRIVLDNWQALTNEERGRVAGMVIELAKKSAAAATDGEEQIG